VEHLQVELEVVVELLIIDLVHERVEMQVMVVVRVEILPDHQLMVRLTLVEVVVEHMDQLSQIIKQVLNLVDRE
jgi:hypothetical protein